MGDCGENLFKGCGLEKQNSTSCGVSIYSVVLTNQVHLPNIRVHPYKDFVTLHKFESYLAQY